jgi:hypothetical protein
MPFSRSFLFASALAICAAPLHAIQVLWEFDFPMGLVPAPDGSPDARAFGHFTYDADLQQYSEIDFTTTSKGEHPGAHYTRAKPGHPVFIFGMTFLGASADGKAYEFFMAYIPPVLTNSGGTASACLRAIRANCPAGMTIARKP